jgi:hypothetical protein
MSWLVFPARENCWTICLAWALVSEGAGFASMGGAGRAALAAGALFGAALGTGFLAPAGAGPAAFFWTTLIGFCPAGFFAAGFLEAGDIR